MQEGRKRLKNVTYKKATTETEPDMANIFNVTNLKKTYYYLKRNGVMQTIGAALERMQAPYFADYTYVLPEAEVLEKQKNTCWENPIKFSVVVPAYETKEEFLSVVLESLLQQTYPYWELIIADASSSERVQKECAKYPDRRIRYISLKENAGISENTNRGIEVAQGDYIGLLDHDDYLTPDALFEMANAIKQGKEKNLEYEFLYSDEDKCDTPGKQFYDPHFKTDFNLDLFLTNNYICHFCVMKKELMQSLKFRKEFDGAQDYDLCLRAVSALWDKNSKVEETICHIPKVLYHWRCHNDSTAANPRSKRYAYEAGKRALQSFVEQRGWKAAVEEMPHVGFYKVVYEKGIFSQREDVAAAGSKEIRYGKLYSGCYDKEGKLLYRNLPFCYSGYIHRAVLSQNVAGLDINQWKINPKYEKIIATFLKENASNIKGTKMDRQKAICEYLWEKGYRLYWDPSGDNL